MGKALTRRSFSALLLKLLWGSLLTTLSLLYGTEGGGNALAYDLKVHVFDLSDLATRTGFSDCVVENMVYLNPETGWLQLLGNDSSLQKHLSHKLGPQSGAWWLYRASPGFPQPSVYTHS